MLTRWSDFDRTLAVFDELQRRMNRVFEGYDVRMPNFLGATTWPSTNLYDTGKELVLKAQLPGLSEKEVNITGNQDSITISGERKTEVPEGYSVHREERSEVQFSRSFALPVKVDLEKTTASMKNGILTVTMAKAAEAQPRNITVKAQ